VLFPVLTGFVKPIQRLAVPDGSNNYMDLGIILQYKSAIVQPTF